MELWSIMKMRGASVLDLFRDPASLRADVTVLRARREYRCFQLAQVEDPLARAVYALTLAATED